MTENTSGALVLLSGGLDSTTLLHYVVKRMSYTPIRILSFDYGQRHAKELECARYQGKLLNIADHDIVNMQFMAPLLKQGTSLVAGGNDIPDLVHLPPGERDQPPTYVPHRNMILLSIACACAESNHLQYVFYGAHSQDQYGYWDCTPEFITRMNNVLSLNRRTPIQIKAPFANKTKADLIRTGLELGIDYAQTWSCYRGGEKPCGTCPTCIERLRAFEEAGAPDPLS